MTSSDMTPNRSGPRRMFVNRGDKPEKIIRDSTCSVLKDCCSCPLLDVGIADQLAQKTQELKGQIDALAPEFSGVSVADCGSSPFSYDYRCVSKLVVGEEWVQEVRDRSERALHKRNSLRPSSRSGSAPAGKRRWVKIGLYAPGSHNIIDIGSCPVQTPLLNGILNSLRTEISNEPELSIYNEITKKGEIRYIVMREGYVSRQVLLTFVTSTGEKKALRPFARRICERHPEIMGVLQHVNGADGNAIFQSDGSAGEGETSVLVGASHIMDTVCSLQMKFSSTTFMQVNPLMAEKLYFRIAELAACKPSEKVLDLYCGAGSISLVLSKTARDVVGIEETPSAVADARDNAKNNGISHANFYAGRTEDLLPDLINNGCIKDIDVVTMNPSRRGCQPSVLERVAALQPRIIIYMSCYAPTLIRDMKILDQQGYQPISLEPYDMFPRTNHFETLACFIRK